MKSASLKKGIITLIIIIVFIGMGILPSIGINVIEKATILTHPGNILYVGGSGEGNYTKIQDAVDDAVDGDTVFVFDDSSPYNGSIVINKSINLIGEDKETTVIQRGGIKIMKCKYVGVKGFTLTRNSYSIYFVDTKYSVVSDNIMNNNGDNGIRLVESSLNTIFGNKIENYQYGIHLDHLGDDPCTYNSIINNTIGNISWKGIRLHHSENNLISGNTICSSEYGIDVFKGNHNLIYHNNLFDNNYNGDDDATINYWDNGYPSGGNYWDDYTGEDNFSGPNQDIPGSDGIGDTLYEIPGGDIKDYYPLMEPWINNNSPPIVEITYPNDGDYVRDEIIVTGTANDCDGDETLEWVKFRWAEEDWKLSNGTIFWNYTWDTRNVSDGECSIFAKSYDGELYSIQYTLSVIVDNSPLKADAHGPYYGLINKPVNFSGSASGGYRPYNWHWDFGDGTTSDEQNPTKSYSNPGNYSINLTVTDNVGNTTNDISWAWIQDGNEPPDKPDIEGPKNIRFDKIYYWNFTSIDPEGKNIWFYIDWDDWNSRWYGPYNSGEEITITHQYIYDPWAPLEYTIRAKAKDVYGDESNWSEFEVNIPRFRASSNLWLKYLFEQYPILERVCNIHFSRIIFNL
jgi:parallel beta-helix repeat protein